jgi:hypothetical protein
LVWLDGFHERCAGCSFLFRLFNCFSHLIEVPDYEGKGNFNIWYYSESGQQA